MAAVGLAWLAGSFLTGARALHQAVLAAALIAFPAGRVRGVASWLLVGLAGLTGLQLLPQLGVAALFAAIALLVLAGSRTDPVPSGIRRPRRSPSRRRSEPRGGAPGCSPPDSTPPWPYSATSSCCWSEGQLVGLDGLAAVLGDALGDPDLRVHRWDASAAAYVDAGGQRVARGNDQRWLTVTDRDGPVAALEHRAPALDDGPTVAAVSSAIRLAMTHLWLQEEQRARLLELEASRARIVGAADRQRERAAAELRRDVDAPLRVAQSELRAVRPSVRDTEAAAASTSSSRSWRRPPARSPTWSRASPRPTSGMVACDAHSTRWPKQVPFRSAWPSPATPWGTRRQRPHYSIPAARR